MQIAMATEADMQMAEARNPNAGDERLSVQFYVGKRLNMKLSAENNRPMFEDQTMVKIRVPGDKHTVLDVKANTDERHPNSHVRRFPKQWANFKAGMAGAVVGTPLSEWPGVTRSQVETLAYHGVHSVEQLANMSDSLGQQFMGNFALRQKAQDYLAAAKEGAGVSKMRAELEARDLELASLKANQEAQAKQMAELLARLNAQPSNDNREAVKPTNTKK